MFESLNESELLSISGGDTYEDFYRIFYSIHIFMVK